MGRNRKYDRQTVLDKAMGLFWQKGFQATSIAEMAQTTGLNTASMYKEFGDNVQALNSFAWTCGELDWNLKVALEAAGKAAAMEPEGLMVLSTPNRTPQSRVLMVEAAERLGAIPAGTHDWDDFITPDELDDILRAAGLCMSAPVGIAFSPGKGLHLSADLSLNYLVTAVRA